MSDTPAVRSAPAQQDTIRLEGLPERIRHMLALVLAHRDLLTAYPSGTLELHFRHDSVKPKVTCSPEG
jgi:hypothetical protein